MDQVILKDIQDMIRKPVTSELLSYVSDQAALVIPCYSNQTISSSSAMDGKYGVLPPLASFIGFLVKRSSVRTGTLLGSLVFLQRLQQTLANIAKGMPCTSHRIFLATLIVTSKALHDTSPKNKHWAKYAAYFALSEINLMEKQLLSLMNYHILISPADLSNVYYRFKESTMPSLPTPSVLISVAMGTNVKVTKPAPAALSMQADIPKYAALYTADNNASLSNSSLSSSTSTDSDTSVATLEEERDATANYYYGTSSLTEEKAPPKAYCRNRKLNINLLHYDQDELL